VAVSVEIGDVLGIRTIDERDTAEMVPRVGNEGARDKGRAPSRADGSAPQSGRPEVYVRPSSGEDRKWQISFDGGAHPVWSPAGGEIFYLCGEKFMAVPIRAAGDEIDVGDPKILFENRHILLFDVARDGDRFLVAEDPNPGAQSRLDLVVNWFAEVERKVAAVHTP